MQTLLDTCHELELIALRYQGDELIAEVCERMPAPGRRVSQGSAAYTIRFAHPAAHALTEEFPATVANWIDGDDLSGFLRRVNTPALRAALGLNVAPFEGHSAYALITVDEVLTVFCRDQPEIGELRR